MRLASSFTASGLLHGLLLGWLVMASVMEPGPRPRTIYDQEIRPYESHLVWYNLGKKLPEVKPGATREHRRPPRARTRSSQSIVAGKRDDARPPQFIAMPAPAIELPRPLPLPNALAVAVPKPVRRFAPPAETRPQTAHTQPAALPEAPALQLSKTNPISMATPAERPVRPFAAPPETHPKAVPAPAVRLPEAPPAPRLAAPGATGSLPIESPEVRPQRAFSMPAAPPAPAAPPPSIGEAPSLPETTSTPDATRTLAIVGLKPADTPDLPIPPGSHAAGVSAGPKPRPATDDAANESAPVTVPGLLTRSGGAETRAAVLSALAAPTSEQRLRASLHAARNAAPAPAEAASAPAAARVAGAPEDGRLAGRYVYMIAISMPNVTSYSGSWIVWFAERRPEPGDPPRVMTPPAAVHKVDPKYIRSAAEEGVEGIVRLAAVIRKTGAVDSVELLRHLDDRLDQSAKEALSKWEFEPALRDGRPVDVDAIFEIPFRLAAKPRK